MGQPSIWAVLMTIAQVGSGRRPVGPVRPRRNEEGYRESGAPEPDIPEIKPNPADISPAPLKRQFLGQQ